MRNPNNPYRGKVILLLSTVFMSLVTRAQLSYTFSASNVTYSAISSATTLINANINDATSSVQDIGFTFTYGCTNYTRFIASSNGFISLGNVLTDDLPDNAMATTGQGPLLAPLWDDLRTNNGNGKVSFRSTGTVPNRILTVEWLNMRWKNGATTDAISFQVKLYETSNNIEFCYRLGTATPSNSPNASIGIIGGTITGDYYSLNGTGTSPAAQYGIATNNLSVRPANNQLYRFVPAVCPSPGNERSNMAFWVKGNAGTSTTTNGNTISSWNDQSGNLRNATSAATATSPVYFDNSTSNVNFNPVINFKKDNSHFMDITPGGILATGNDRYTVYTVVKPGTGNQTAPGKYLFSGAFDVNGNRYNSFDIRSNGAFNDSWCKNDLIVNNQWTAAYPSITTYDYDASKREMFVGGASVGTKNNGDIRNSPDAYCALGCQRGTTNQEFFDGSIAEIVTYTDISHSATTRSKVESYLALKYGITLAHDYLSSNGTTIWNKSLNMAYNSNIIGIGRDDNSALSQKQSKSTSVNADILTLYIGSNKQTNQANNNGTFSADRSFLMAANNNENFMYSSTGVVTEVPSNICCRLRREWLMQKTNFPNTDVKLEFDFNIITPGYTPLNAFDLRLLVDGDGSFNNATVLNSPTVTFSVNASVVTVTVNSSYFTSTPYFTLASASANTPLPVKFIKLGANCKTNTANISWTTENEMNLAHYTVERSADGKNFMAIADVKTNTAATLQQSYNWTDAAPLPGTSYYRLKANSTAATYSPVFTFTDCGTQVVKLSNNIAGGEPELFIQLSQNARVEIDLFDMLGRKYTVAGLTGKQELTQGSYHFPVSSGLRTGIYMLSVNINGNRKLFRIIK